MIIDKLEILRSYIVDRWSVIDHKHQERDNSLLTLILCWLFKYLGNINHWSDSHDRRWLYLLSVRYIIKALSSILGLIVNLISNQVIFY